MKSTDCSVNFGNHRYTNEQNCILFICKLKCKILFAPPPPNPKTVPTALLFFMQCAAYQDRFDN